MASSHNYAPSAPPLPDQVQPPSQSSSPSSYHGQYRPSSSSYNPSGQHPPPSSPYNPSGQHRPSSSPFSPSGQHPPSSWQQQQQQQNQPYNYSQQQSSSSPHGYPSGPPPPSHGGGGGGYFPPGTHPEIIRSFQMVDKDGSGFIDERELQEALSMGYQKFSLGTVRLLMFLFKNPNETLKIGPNEFSALWSCLGQWRAIFERFDRDRSGKIDTMELRDALYSLGYRVPDSVLQVLISKYDDGSGRRGELNFDSFVECGMIVKGLTEKFKEKDPRYTGSATLSYETFMSMVLPFLVS